VKATARQDVVALPPQTRMLLESEGSTTILLEALTGRRMAVRVTAQASAALPDVDVDARVALDAPGLESVIVRESVLVADGVTVSVNRVVFAESTAPWLVRDPSDVPIGHQLRRRGALQHRVLLGSGVDTWPLDGGDQPCVFKKYVIRSSTGGDLYVHERFNPHIVPLG
jgi:chorismate-pyruvate lyase